MPYTKQDLVTLYSLEEDEVNQTLMAAELSVDSESYTDEQIQTGFELIRSYFNNGQASDYDTAAELFKQNQAQQLEADVQAKTNLEAKGKKFDNSNDYGVAHSEQLNVAQLLAHASEQVGTRISLVEAVQIFSACGLPDKEQYTAQERDRFLVACEQFKQQNKSYEEVAAHFGFSPNTDESPLLEQVGKIIEGMEAQASLLTDELLLESAASKALSDAQKYMLYYASASASGEQVKQFWAQLREHAKTRLLGKAQARLIRAEPQPNFIGPSSSSLTDSLENSNNGMTGV